MSPSSGARFFPEACQSSTLERSQNLCSWSKGALIRNRTFTETTTFSRSASLWLHDNLVAKKSNVYLKKETKTFLNSYLNNSLNTVSFRDHCRVFEDFVCLTDDTHFLMEKCGEFIFKQAEIWSHQKKRGNKQTSFVFRVKFNVGEKQIGKGSSQTSTKKQKMIQLFRTKWSV